MQLGVVDYSQLLKFPNAEGSFEQSEASAEWMKGVAFDLNIHALMLAQLSEQGVKGDDSYSPKVKGGGAIPAATDYLLATRYDEGEARRLNVKLKLARGNTQGGTEKFVIHPDSGLLEQTEWNSQPIDIIEQRVLVGSEQLPLRGA